MSHERLSILHLSLVPPSPATYGAQRRIQGLLGALAKRHDVTGVSLLSPSMDAEAAERGIRELGAEAILVSWRPWAKRPKRLQQVRSLASRYSFERRLHTLPSLQRTLDLLLHRRRYDLVHVEFPCLAHYRLRQAPPGEPSPRLLLDEHNVEYDLGRQMTGLELGLGRHLYNSLNWRKIRREELAAWRRFDGVMFTSAQDEERAHSSVPSVRSRLIPNAVDLKFFAPSPEYPAPDGRTVLFFGTFNYFPNLEGMLFFLRETWPRLAASHPGALLKIIGADPPAEVRAFQGPRVELAGLVPDVRPHIAQAAATIVPLRIGGGTRLKVLEAMAMAKPIVSTRLGAEGIDATDGRELLLADEPEAFAAAVGRVLDDGALAGRLGAAARALAEQRYSWDAVGLDLERFFREILADPARS